MSDTIIESLGIEINSNSKDVVDGVNALVQSLNKLKPASKHATSGLDVFSKALGNLKNIVKSTEESVQEISSQLGSVNSAANGISSSAIDSVKSLSDALKSLSGVRISKSIAGQLTSISTVLSGMNINSGITQINELGKALPSLSNLPAPNLSNYLKQIKKLPETFAELQKVDVSKFTTQIKDLANALHPLGDEMERISNGFSKFPERIQRLITSTDKLSNSNKKAAGSFTDLYLKVRTGFTTLKRVGSIIGGFVNESTEYIENVNLFSVSMGEFAIEAAEYAELVRDKIGIDPSDWMRAQGVFMTMATGFGVTGERAKVMSQNLTQLGYDIASFYNYADVNEAMKKLKSGLAGELEPLRAIGYDLSQAKLEATALALGIDKSVSSMTQAEKAQLRYYAIMTQVTEVQGDMARTLDDPANQLRVFRAEANLAGREIGNVFLPALNAILPYAIAITRVFGNLAGTIAGLFGHTPEKVKESTKELVTGTDETQENLEMATEEAKKLKSYMLGFDELNVINPNTDSGIEDTSDMFDFELPEYDFLKNVVESKVNGIVEKMKEWLGITEEIDTWSEFFDTRIGNILKNVGTIGGAILLWKLGEGFLAGITLLWNLLKTKAVKFAIAVTITMMGVDAAKWIMEKTEGAINDITAVVGASLLGLGAVLAFIGGNLPLGIALMAVGAISLAAQISMNTTKLSDEVKGVIAVITAAVSLALLAVGAILAFSGANIPLGIALIAGGALVMASAVTPNWTSLSTEVQNTISLIMTIVGTALLAVGAILAFTGVNIPLGIGLMLVGAASLGTAVAINWDFIVDAIQGPVGLAMGILGGAAMLIGAILLFTGVNIPLGVGLLVGGAASLGTATAVNWDFLVDKVKGIWGKIKEFWKEKIAPVFTAEWWKKLGISIINGLSAGIEGGINGIITAFESMINWVVNGLNKISFTVPDWVPEIGGTVVGVNLSPVSFGRVSIPRFAEGGFPEQGQMFIAREAGAEMVGNIGRRTAVVNNEQIVESISVGVAEANSEQNALLREQNSLLRELVAKDSGVYLDGRSLSASVDKHKRERGRELIVGGVL